MGRIWSLVLGLPACSAAGAQADDIPCSHAHPIIWRFARSTIRGDQQQGDGTAALPFDRAAADKARNRRVELVEQ